MAFITANSGKTAYGVKKLIFDKVEDLMTFDNRNLYPGTTAFIIDSSTTYMLNSQMAWIKVNLGAGSGSGDGDGNIPSEIVYDGGVIVG